MYNLTANAIVHVIILLIFWVVFYRFVAFGVARSAFLEHIQPPITKLVQSDDEVTHYIKLAKAYTRVAKTDELTGCSQTINTQSLVEIIGIICTLVAVLAFIGTKGEIKWRQILKENALTYLFIGTVEFVFFMKIARNYAPILPSDINTATRKAIMKRLDV